MSRDMSITACKERLSTYIENHRYLRHELSAASPLILITDVSRSTKSQRFPWISQYDPAVAHRRFAYDGLVDTIAEIRDTCVYAVKMPRCEAEAVRARLLDIKSEWAPTFFVQSGLNLRDASWRSGVVSNNLYFTDHADAVAYQLAA